MKITWIEELIKEGLVKSYEYCYGYDGKTMFIDIKTGKTVIFTDDLQKITRIAKRNNARIQYICLYTEGWVRYHKLCLCAE